MNRPFRVLLIEDNDADADLAAEVFDGAVPRVEVGAVSDGAEALAFLAGEAPFEDAERPDLVLLDLNLPKLDGRQVLAEIRSREALRHLPVIVLTSSDAEKDIRESYALGANAYVIKPVGLKAYQTAFRALVTFWFGTARLP